MDEFEDLREAVETHAKVSQASMVAFQELLANISAQDLKGLSQDRALAAFASHRLMADYAVLLLHEARESLALDKPDVEQVRESLRLGMFTIQIQRIAFAQVSKAGFEISKRRASNQGKVGSDGLHNKEGGSRSKAAEIKSIWRTGKYSSRDLCAEQECARLNMSFSAARKALRNIPIA